ncbi:hypothetical protein Kisp02_54640 [Kineosporia sp. NBRC 101731]|nr:hypothetical protein Kisp02_54640 [Kineosporia sp. NBRC 101731]
MFSPTDDSYVRDFLGRPVAGVPVKVFTARTGGTQITDLVAVDDAGNLGAAIPSGILVSDRDGLIPAFAGPDGGPVAVWVNTGQGGVRNLLRADSTGGGGGGGTQFTSVLGKSSGTVTGADIVADTTVSGTYAQRWQPATAYTANQIVQLPDGSYGSAKANHTSPGSFAASAWNSINLAAGSDAWLKQHGSNIDGLIVGAITRDSNNAATGAGIVWPDGTTGTYAATTVSSAFVGAVDAYTVTYAGAVTKTVTQPAVARNANGAVTNRPAMTVS